MEQNKPEIASEFLPVLRVFKDGTVERLIGIEIVQPGTDPTTGVTSKDVTIEIESSSIRARIYLPSIPPTTQKLPVLVYYHGGGFCIESTANPQYQNFLNLFSSKANILIVSIDYRLAPEFPVPRGHEDSWIGLNWVASHSQGQGPDEWINNHGDLSRLYVAGDSAGGNIAHHMAMRASSQDLTNGVKIEGEILFHPMFWGKERIGSESSKDCEFVEKFWHYASAGGDMDVHWLNPFVDEAPKLEQLACSKVLIFVAGEDWFRDRGWLYCEKLKQGGFSGVVEVDEAKGKGHTFHLEDPDSEDTLKLMDKAVDFVNGGRV